MNIHKLITIMAAREEGTIKCRDVEAVYKCISDHEEEFRVKFITTHKDKDFGKLVDTLPDPGKHCLRWRLDYGGQSPKIECDGVPFYYMHRHVLICHQGRDRNEKTKARRKALKQFDNTSDPESTPKKRRKLVQDTKKVDCPASIYIVQVLRFPEKATQFQGLEPTSHSKVLLKKRLREEYQENASSIQTETVFYVSLPSLSCHAGHPVNNIAAGLRESLDPRILHKIAELASRGVTQVPDVRKQLDAYVQSELFHSDRPPARTRRRYFPTDMDIRNAVRQARKEAIHTKVDQKNMAMLVSLWRQADRAFFEYRPLRPGCDSDKFLFCCQTQWQHRLLCRYGGAFTVLDAVYRGAGYPLPLFLLMVRTNMGYVVVGMFVSHSDTAGDIAEALGVFKKWNPDWKPAAFMVDYFDPEIEATETVFPECTAIFSYHRCETLWQDWLRDSSEVADTSMQTRIVRMMHRIAMATGLKEQAFAVKGLKAMPVWRENELVSNWFSTFWLSCMKRWTAAFQSEVVRVGLGAVNGLKQQAEACKHHEAMGEHRDCSLSEMATLLYTKYFPEAYRRYVEFSARYSSGYLKYSSDVPRFLHSRPRFIVEKVKKSMSSAIEPGHIQDGQNGHFLVKGEKSQCYKVFFGSEDKYPSCSCSYWSRLYLPCKHFCAVFQHVPGWGWDQLGASYRNNPLFLLDEEVLQASDLQKCQQGSLKDRLQETEDAEMDDATEESTVVPGSEMQESKRPQRAGVKCKKLVQKNMDLLDKLQSQVSHVKNETLLEDMLKTLQSLSHKLQWQKNTVKSNVGVNPRTKTRTRMKGSKSETEPQLTPDTDVHTREGDGKEVVCEERSTSNQAPVEGKDPNQSNLCIGQAIPQNHPGSVYHSHSVQQSSQEPPSNLHTAIEGKIPSQGHISSSIPQEPLSDSVKISDVARKSLNPSAGVARGSDSVEMVVFKPEAYALTTYPTAEAGVQEQGVQRAGIPGDETLHSNITFVSDASALNHQEILSAGEILIHSMDPMDQGSFVIDSTHEGITVTVSSANIDEAPSVT